MILFKNPDFSNPNSIQLEEYQRLYQLESMHPLGKFNIRKSFYNSYPLEIRHWLSLFPGNFLDPHILKNVDIHNSVASEFSQMLDSETISEREILNYLQCKNNYLLISCLLKKYYTFGHHDAYIFPEFELGNKYKADFLLVGKNSDGWSFVFIELESPKGKITINDGRIGAVFRKGIQQIDDWGNWLETSFSSLIDSFNKHRQTKKNHNYDQLDDNFYRYEKYRIHYIVVAGRRTDFSDLTYKDRRNHLQEKQILILHYDNLIDALNSSTDSVTY